jgi:MFS transporter, ACS family, solute carrier family 17 (sodium-dependent inorganic phosphate cotransporter), other
VPSHPGKNSALPRRVVLVALAFLASALAYTDRVNIAVAAIAMKEQFHWSETQKGWVLSAFFAGYLAFMFAGGLLAARFGGRRLLGLAVIAWSVFTLLTPAAASISLLVLVLARWGMGVGEAAMFPASYGMFARWVPAGERARALSVLLCGIPVGTVLGNFGSGWLIGRYGWPSAFYAFGLLGFVWAVAWFSQIEDDPLNSRRIGSGERELLAAIPAVARAGARPALRRLLLRGPVFGVVAGHFASTWSLYVLISWLPSYFHDAQKLSIASAGIYSAAPWIAMFFATATAGIASDRLLRAGVPVTRVRKIMQCGGLVLSALFLLFAREAHSAAAALAVLCASTAALGFTNCGYAPAILDVAGPESAVIGGFSNSFATIPGIIGVTLVGWLVDLTGSYSAPFLVTASVSVAGALGFLVFFRAELPRA